MYPGYKLLKLCQSQGLGTRIQHALVQQMLTKHFLHAAAHLGIVDLINSLAGAHHGMLMHRQ